MAGTRSAYQQTTRKACVCDNVRKEIAISFKKKEKKDRSHSDAYVRDTLGWNWLVEGTIIAEEGPIINGGGEGRRSVRMV
jgi:hypothetical protein